jgi:hypothetical protein
MAMPRKRREAGYVVCMEKITLCTKLVWDLQGKRLLERSRHRRENNINICHRNWSMGVWIWFVWLIIGTSRGLLWKYLWTYEFNKKRKLCLPAQQLPASQEGFWSTKLGS